MSEYRKPEGNLIESDSGSVKRLGRAGLDVTFNGERLLVNSEMLHPPRSIVIYASEGDLGSSSSASEILAFVRSALEWDGFTVEIA